MLEFFGKITNEQLEDAESNGRCYTAESAVGRCRTVCREIRRGPIGML